MARKPRDAQELRRASLRLLIAQWGGPTALAKKLQLSGSSYLTQILGSHRPFTEKTARSFEEKLELPNGWMDKEHDASTAAPVEVSEALISRVVHAVGAAVEDARADLTTHKFSEIISLAYEHARKNGVIDDAYIKRLVSLGRKE